MTYSSFESRSRLTAVEFLVFDAIDGHHVGAAPLALEAVPAGCGADIEHALPAQIFGQRVGVEAGFEVGDGYEAGNYGAVEEFQAVIGRVAGEGLRLQTDKALEFGVSRRGIGSQRVMIAWLGTLRACSVCCGANWRGESGLRGRFQGLCSRTSAAFLVFCTGAAGAGCVPGGISGNGRGGGDHGFGRREVWNLPDSGITKRIDALLAVALCELMVGHCH